jgi:hypothetical protein
MMFVWAIVFGSVLFLLHKHRTLGRTVRAVVIIAAVLIVVWDWMDSPPVDPRWEEPPSNGRARVSNVEFAQSNECLNPSTGHVRPVSGHTPWCDSHEEIHERGTPIDHSPDIVAHDTGTMNLQQKTR